MRRAVLLGSGLLWIWMAAPAAAQDDEGAEGLGSPRPSGEAGTPAEPTAPPLDDVPEPPGAEDGPPEGSPPEAVPPPPSEPRYPSGAATRTPSLELDESADLRIPTSIRTRLRVLDADLSVLANRGGNSIVDGILSILSGGLSITLGIVLDDSTFLSTYLYLWGSANIALGVIDIAISPDTSGPHVRFAHMPMTSTEEVRERLLYGERSLEHLARRMRLSRILAASINIAVGVAVLPIVADGDTFKDQAPLSYFVVIGSAISMISGIVGLVTRSDAERRWEAYRELRQRLDRDRSDEEALSVAPRPRPTLRLSGGALPGGGALGLVTTF